MSSSTSRIITIFGGTGFIGRQLLRRLSQSENANSLHVRVASRNPPSPAWLQRMAPRLGGTTVVNCDLSDESQVLNAVRGASDVVNCVGILFETPSKGVTFRSVQEKGPATICDAIVAIDKKSVERVVHVSAIGANLESPSEYARTKAAGEHHVLKLAKEDLAHVSILRPSIVFGPEDSFFNRFAELSKFLPFLPLVGGGKSKFQPVHVGDVTEAIVKALAIEGKEGHGLLSGSVYELGGKTILTFEGLMKMLLEVSGRRRLLIPVPYPVANLQGALFESIHRLAPSVPPMLTRDQVALLKSDNIVSPGTKTFSDLGIEPLSCDASAISYIR